MENLQRDRVTRLALFLSAATYPFSFPARNVGTDAFTMQGGGCSSSLSPSARACTSVLVLGLLLTSPNPLRAEDCVDYREAMRSMGEVQTLGYPSGVAVTETFACVTGGASGLSVVNLLNPAAPKITGGVDTPGFAEGVAIAGQHAYVADGGFGLQVIDISDPGVPQIVETVVTAGSAASVTTAGQYVIAVAHPAKSEALTTALRPAWPNPGRGGMTLEFDLARNDDLRLEIYDVTGRHVRRLLAGPTAAGRHVARWDGRNTAGVQVSAGTYVVRLASPGSETSSRVTVIR